MEIEKILSEKDSKDIEDIILINALNSQYIRKNFKGVIEHLSNRVGFGDDGHIIFTFWGNLDEYDKANFYNDPFEGLEVDYLGAIKIFDLQDVYYYVSLASQRYIELNPNERDEIDGILNRMKNSFNCE